MASEPDLKGIEDRGIYAYVPNKILPIVFAVLIGLSLAVHTYQNLLVLYDVPPS